MNGALFVDGKKMNAAMPIKNALQRFANTEYMEVILVDHKVI